MDWLEEHPPLGEYCLVVAGISAEEEKAASRVEEIPWWAELSLRSMSAHYELEIWRPQGSNQDEPH